jgi:hypothetical protein
MYNGIGLATSRGSGTSGHIQKNLSHLRPRNPLSNAHVRADTYAKDMDELTAGRKEIREHEMKRRIMLKVEEYREELMESGLDEKNIERKVRSFKESLLRDTTDTDEQSVRKREEDEKQVRNDRLAKAFADEPKGRRKYGHDNRQRRRSRSPIAKRRSQSPDVQ